LLAALVVAHAALITWLGVHHEPWRDEADAWLMARDASVGELLRIMGAAGTPSLWYFVQLPFAKLGFPFVTQAVLNSAAGVAAAAIFLFRARLPLALRIAFVFGYFMAFEYSVVARSYALSMLLAFSAAALYPLRERRPLAFGVAIGLLANTNAHSFFVASGFAAPLLLECVAARFRGPPLRALLAAGAGILAAFVQLIPPADGQMTGLMEAFGPGNLIRGIKLAFVPTQNEPWALVLGLSVLSAGLLSLLDRPKALLMSLSAYFGLSYLFVFKYGGFVRHFGFLLVVLLLALWIGEDEPPRRFWPARLRFMPGAERLGTIRRVAHGLLGVSLLLSVYYASVAWRAERALHFSEAQAMARYLESQGLATRRIAANPPGWETAILAYFPKLAFYYPALDETRTFMKWDRAYRDAALTPHAEAIARLTARFSDWADPERGFLLVLGNGELAEPERYGLRLRYATPGKLFAYGDERFFLYEPLPK
jgi:hypothetical protein